MWRLCYEGSTLEKRTLLKKFFGHSAFRGGQEALIDAILSGRDVLGVMPTGGGKSICYQIPALMLPGLTIVVSPLISLMKDQVAALTEVGVPAAFLNSSLSLEQLRETYAKTAKEQYKLLYVAPERLENESFLSLISHVPVSLLAVDEAHCISQWGQDFRPSYLKIADFIAQLPTRPVVAAFTATATKQVRADIISQLGLRNPLLNITGFDRPNLYFAVQHPTSKLAATLQLVRERDGKAGIVYCNTRASVERVCEFLSDKGIAATRYHAGLSEEERHANQDDFRFDRKTVMVATNAFGMGIDKSNVSFVIHYNMPKSIEAYYQEAGRAGRDGAEADCILLFNSGDVQTARFLINNGSDNEEMDAVQREEVRRQDLGLRQMTGYCKTTDCLRGYILSYFGQSHPETCGCCGTTACLALLNDAVKKGGVMASSSVGGLSGAFIPVSEDEGMIAAASSGALTLDKLEAMTCVCSVGLDMIAVPGDTSAETISAIIADEAAVGMVNSKTTAVRLIPAPGKQVGDEVSFGGLLGAAPIMPVHPESAAGFIARGGRIPAPMQSLKN